VFVVCPPAGLAPCVAGVCWHWCARFHMCGEVCCSSSFPTHLIPLMWSVLISAHVGGVCSSFSHPQSLFVGECAGSLSAYPQPPSAEEGEDLAIRVCWATLLDRSLAKVRPPAKSLDGGGGPLVPVLCLGSVLLVAHGRSFSAGRTSAVFAEMWPCACREPRFSTINPTNALQAELQAGDPLTPGHYLCTWLMLAPLPGPAPVWLLRAPSSVLRLSTVALSWHRTSC
jgi:hypothetical protein